MYTSSPTFFHDKKKRAGDDGLLIDPLFSSVCLSCALLFSFHDLLLFVSSVGFLVHQVQIDA